MSDNQLNQDLKKNLYYDVNKKSMLVAYLILIFLGYLGIHRFYLDKKKSAIVMLTLTIIGWATIFIGVGVIILIAVGLWWFVDLFLTMGYVNQHNHKLVESLTE